MLQVPAFHQRPHQQCRFSWREEDLELLGRISDGEVAKRLGLSPSTVQRKRTDLGVEPFQDAWAPIEWTPEILARLGTVSDPQIAREMGIGLATVRKKREELGRSAWRENLPVLDTPELGEILKLPMREIRAQTGLEEKTILRHRRKLGVEETVRYDHASASPLRIRCRWSKEEEELLGTAPDADIAVRIGRTQLAVASRRHSLGIPPRAKQGSPRTRKGALRRRRRE